MRLSKCVVPVVTDESGDAVVYTPQINGIVRMIAYLKPSSGGLDNGSALEMLAAVTGITVWEQAALAASMAVYPHAPAHDSAGVAITYATDHPVYTPIPICDEKIKITISSGGNALAGSFVFVVEGDIAQ